MTDLTLAQLAAFNVTLLVALAGPGPAFLLAAHNAVVGGRRIGVLTGLGLATSAALWTACALLGLAALFELVPWLYLTMKVIGACYLLYLAWGIWRKSRDVTADTAPAKIAHPFRQGVLVNLANPKSVLFAGAIIVVIFPAGLSATDSAIIVLNHWLVEVIFYAIMANLLSTPAAQRAYGRAKAWIERATATVLGALGLRMLFER